ncbi:synaptotagmin-16-like, partial [Notamacropus eugenii]|uniref:synaptotagmin-16-like n=1 Tax=Notamacropus eugenii TaxID=9315 RepID=UPI003B67F915
TSGICSLQVVVLTMASQDSQNFFQPLSSWMSRVYEAVQQVGDTLSASLLNLSKQNPQLNGELDPEVNDGDVNESNLEDREKQDYCQSQGGVDSVLLETNQFPMGSYNADLWDLKQSPLGDSSSKASQQPPRTCDNPKKLPRLSPILEEDCHLEKLKQNLQHGFEDQAPAALENINGEEQGKLTRYHLCCSL